MTRLIWDGVGQRLFETGVDRGVFYPASGAGVPWNGLISVNETPTGGQATPFYIDGYKYQNRAAPEEFEADLEAYTYPDEFEAAAGLRPLGNGLSIGLQHRSSFGLCYRTRIGNDVDLDRHGYKIHMVYNALAAPSNKNYQTTGANPEALTFTWSVTTKPVKVTGYRPTPYMMVDTTKVAPPLLAQLEDILYGSASTASRLPTPTELIALFVGAPTFFVTDLGNGLFTVSGTDEQVRLVDPNTFQITNTAVTDNGNGTFTATSS